MYDTINETNYSWGTLRTIYAGTRMGLSDPIGRAARFTVVIHPGDWEAIAALADGESTTFKAECGTRWTVAADAETFNFTADGNRFVKVARSEAGQ